MKKSIYLPPRRQVIRQSVGEVLIHESAHLRRRDCHWNLLRHLATSLLFFNPCLWYLSRKIETSAEEVRDEFVVKFDGNRQQYANRLVDIAEHCSAPVSPAGVVSFRSVLTTRVNRILDTLRKLSTQVGNLHRTLLISGGLTGATAAGFIGLSPAETTATTNQNGSALIGLKPAKTSTIPNQDGSIVPQLAGAMAAGAKTSTTTNQDNSDPKLALEEAGVQYLKSQLRYTLDRVIFPPAGKGANDPGVLRGALSSVFSTRSIMNKLEAEPDVFLKVVKRMEKWSPDYPADYNPGWKYTQRLDKAAVAKEVANARKKLLPALRNKAILLNEPRYRDALVKLQDLERRAHLTPSPDPLEYRETQIRERTNIHEIQWELIPEYRWHAKVGWKAENYFTDPRVIELCQAIEVDDLKRMQELIDQGANVNAIGKDNMTPLLWAYPDFKFERFQMLLEAGANPNVIVAATVKPQFQSFQPNLNVGIANYNLASFDKGSSVNLMAYQLCDTRYWRAVIKHGGDVNQIDPGWSKNSLLHIALGNQWNFRGWGRAEIKAAVMALVKNGANLNSLNRSQLPPLSVAIRNGQYETATFFVLSGAVLNGRPVKRNGKYELVAMPLKAGRNEPRANRGKRTPVQLVEDMKPFGHYVDNPKYPEEYNASRRKAATERGAKQQALRDAMVQQGAVFEPEQLGTPTK